MSIYSIWFHGIFTYVYFGLFWVYETVYSGEYCKSYFLLIFFICKKRGFFRIGKKTALYHYSGVFAVIAQKKLLTALFYFTLVIGLQKFHESVLYCTCKVFIFAVAFRIEHLSPAVSWVCKLVLVDRYADSVIILIEKFKPVVHVGTFLIGDTLNAIIVYGNIRISCYFDLIAGNCQQVPEGEQDIQIYALFGCAVYSYTTAVESAMCRIVLNIVGLMLPAYHRI